MSKSLFLKFISPWQKMLLRHNPSMAAQPMIVNTASTRAIEVFGNFTRVTRNSVEFPGVEENRSEIIDAFLTPSLIETGRPAAGQQ